MGGHHAQACWSRPFWEYLKEGPCEAPTKPSCSTCLLRAAAEQNTESSSPELLEKSPYPWAVRMQQGPWCISTKAWQFNTCGWVCMGEDWSPSLAAAVKWLGKPREAHKHSWQESCQQSPEVTERKVSTPCNWQGLIFWVVSMGIQSRSAPLLCSRLQRVILGDIK